MNKREVALLLSIFLIVFGSVFASAVADVAYIYRKQFKIDNNIIQEFSNAGLTVDLINENQLPMSFSQYKLLYVGDENFQRENYIPVNSYPVIVANYYHARSWGLTDNEGVSQLAASHPLSVIKDSQLIQVHTSASEGIGGPALSYYFLDISNKAPGLQTVALTETTTSGSDSGDVISYADAGTPLFDGKTQNAKLCFFGIIESDFWTPAAHDMFQECLGLVAAECQTGSDCPPQELSEPFCQDTDVYQTETSYTCENGVLAHCVANETTVLVEQCSHDCFDGECIGQCETNSDCGTDSPVGELFCSDKNVSQLFEIFTCINPTTPDSSCSSEIVEQTIETCEDICLNGVCVDVECFVNSDCDDANESTQDICHNPGTAESFCTNGGITCFSNADCGIDGFIGQLFCSGLDVMQTYQIFTCTNPGIEESSCSSSEENQTITTCTDICIDGECQDIECYFDSDCDDLNPLTFDSCINPGTIVSQCTNEVINCAADNDCGFTGYVGDLFCTGDNVSKNYQTALCINPTQPDSYCEIEVVSDLISQCDFACFDGICIICDENSDCDDQDSQTQDICHNLGTIESFCTNEETEIICSADDECGIPIPLSPLFCSGIEISQLMQTWTCNYPGTTTSYCSSGIEINVLETCAEFCSEGQCVTIECFTHDDCDDSNPSTLDICSNPGTSDSFCTNNPIEITCSSDSDCGTDGFIGENICLENNVTRLFQQFTCNAPATQQSFCSTTVSQLTIEECDFVCSGGQCIPLTSDCIPGEIRDCGTNVGECSKGVELCLTDASWSSDCFGEISPTDEVCDGLDNDCDGETDEGDVCGSSCEDQCAEGERKCYAGADYEGYHICYDFNGDGCTEWSSVTSCSFFETCEDGYCTSSTLPSCEDQCAEGERKCYAGDDYEGYHICYDFNGDSCTEWSSVTSCSFFETCSNGWCN
ncbi:MAG: hypothetical protein KJ600_03530 [Nanoarchaeota archaeon]|nr:hypothetical protein [Nanoarchaeota archaeon]MBU1103599.1 hypothetical protein [Nanoarchaeota archaeon]